MAGAVPFQFSSAKRQYYVVGGLSASNPFASIGVDALKDLLGWYVMWINPDTVRRSRVYKQAVNHTAGAIVTHHYRPENHTLSCSGKCGWVRIKSMIEEAKENALTNALSLNFSFEDEAGKKATQKSIDSRRKANAEKQNQVTSSRNSVSQAKAESQATADAAKKKIDEDNATLSSNNTQIAALKSEVLDLQSKLDAETDPDKRIVLQAQIDTKNSEISDLTSANSVLSQNITNNTNTYNSAVQQVSQYSSRLTELDQQQTEIDRTTTNLDSEQYSLDNSGVVSSLAEVFDPDNLTKKQPWVTSSSHSSRVNNSPLSFLKRLKSIADEPMYYIDSDGIEHFNPKYIKLFTKEYPDGVIYEGYYTRFDIDETVDLGETIAYSFEFIVENETPVTLIQRVLGAYADIGSAAGDVSSTLFGA